MEDEKVPEEYPFKRDLEDLLGSPLARTSEVECLEDGEIEGTNTLQILATTQIGGSMPKTPSKEIGITPSILGSSSTQGGDHRSKEGDFKESVCTPMRMVKASQAEIMARVMASIDKMEKEMSPSSPQEEDNEELQV